MPGRRVPGGRPLPAAARRDHPCRVTQFSFHPPPPHPYPRHTLQMAPCRHATPSASPPPPPRPALRRPRPLQQRRSESPLTSSSSLLILIPADPATSTCDRCSAMPTSKSPTGTVSWHHDARPASGFALCGCGAAQWHEQSWYGRSASGGRSAVLDLGPADSGGRRAARPEFASPWRVPRRQCSAHRTALHRMIDTARRHDRESGSRLTI